MPPKAMQYRANSIIYFKGDISDRIFILNSGKVSLRYSDFETGQEIHELIKTGEFFGVKSAMGKYPREETAVVLQDASVIIFTVPEFERLAAQNTRIIVKMLKVFSNQLRRMHKRVRGLLSSDEQVNPDAGLFSIGEYYYKKRLYKQSIHAFRRYLTYYPSGQFADSAVQNLDAAERNLQQFGQGKGPAPVSGVPVQNVKPERGKELSDVAKVYYNGVSLFSQNRYADAMKEYRKIIELGQDEEYSAKSQYELGRCLFAMGQHDPCIRHYTSLIQQYPKHPDLADALFHIAQCYEAKRENPRALGIYKKIISMTTEEDSIYRKARKAVRAIEGGAS